MAACASCGKSLGFSDRISRNTLCADCRQRQAEERAAAWSALQSELVRLADPTTDATALVAGLPTLEDGASLSPQQRQAERSKALAAAVRSAIADSSLTEDEEQHLLALGDGLGIDVGQLVSADQPLAIEMMIARANAGNLQNDPNPGIILKAGEVAHLVTPANLLKEVVDREYRGGYGGVSFRVAKGVRLNTGRFRGHSVVTGSHVETADTGRLVVTSTRIVFVGSRATMEFAYSKLIAIDGFSDGVRFSVSNRQKASTFQVPSGELVVATVNAAAGQQA